MKVTLIAAAVALYAASLAAQVPPQTGGDPHAGHGMDQQAGATAAARNPNLPPDSDAALAQLNASPRHGEWVDIKMASGAPIKAFVVYPERQGKAPVVLVIHEIFGLSDWIRGVADQLAKEGFIAVAPDFLSGRAPNGGCSAELGSQGSTQAIRNVTPDDRNKTLDAAMQYGASLPSSNGKTAVLGFCWGGSQSFGYAVAQPALSASVVFYGTPPMKTVDGKSVPDPDELTKVKAPVLGLYGGSDARVTATVEPTTAEMKRLGRTYEPHVFEGAAHGFLRQQSGPQDNPGANLKATQQAWPLVLQFLRTHTK